MNASITRLPCKPEDHKDLVITVRRCSDGRVIIRSWPENTTEDIGALYVSWESGPFDTPQDLLNVLRRLTYTYWIWAHS